MSDPNSVTERIKLTPEIVLRAYAAGIFPMAENRDDEEIFWVDPEMRGIIPLDGLRISRSLRKAVRNPRFEVRYNHDFGQVIRACAEFSDDREETWINSEIIYLYTKLFEMGHVHTVECWQDDKLVGGLYGVSLRGAFFGESMFHRERDASKIALVHLVARLRMCGFTLLDTQFVTEHLQNLGAIEVPRSDYHEMLDDALAIQADFNGDYSDFDGAASIDELLQSTTQTS